MSTADLPEARPSGPFLPDPTRSLLSPWLAQALGPPLPLWWEDPAALSRGLAESLSAATERQAAELLLAGRYAELLSLLEELLAAAPADVELLLRKGLCLIELGDGRGALAALTAAERLAPRDPDVLLLKVDALLGSGLYCPAERLARQLLAADPADSFLRYRLAACLALAGKPRQALKELSLALADDLAGFRQAAALDPAFASLRSWPAFRNLLKTRRR